MANGASREPAGCESPERGTAVGTSANSLNPFVRGAPRAGLVIEALYRHRSRHCVTDGRSTRCQCRPRRTPRRQYIARSPSTASTSGQCPESPEADALTAERPGAILSLLERLSASAPAMAIPWLGASEEPGPSPLRRYLPAFPLLSPCQLRHDLHVSSDMTWSELGEVETGAGECLGRSSRVVNQEIFCQEPLAQPGAATDSTRCATPPAWVISTLCGLACSATGMVIVSTPSS